MSTHNPNLKGNVAEAAIACAAIKLGVDVLKPMTEHCRYDLIFDLKGRLLRVQCKWAPRHDDVIKVNLTGSRLTSSGRVQTRYSIEEIDAVAVYCEDLDACYLVPADIAVERRALWLRLAPPKNGQRACLNWASEYELAGAVAQLEVASRWQREGRGFESHQLHSSSSDQTTVVGAHEYRNHFGWYMERAAAGEEFLITKRGKPCARLSPPFEQLIEPPPRPALALVS